MDPSLLAVGWPGEPAFIVSALRAGDWCTVATYGDLDARRPWASVSKMATALAVSIDVAGGRTRLDDRVGPPGSTLAHLMSHSSGLGLEVNDPVVAAATKRIYSNYGIDLAATHVAKGSDVVTWLDQRVFSALSLASARLQGRACEGVVGSTRDMATFAREWVTPTLVSDDRRDASVSAYLPELAGIVPGFGRFTPCPWGLGVEIRGEKLHWMGDWPARSFGHFGRSGALVLVNVDEGLCVVATSTVEFGTWARDLWPAWTSRVRQMVGSS